MQEVEEGDGYSDDDLDALPFDAFHELQEKAIRSTQHIINDEQPTLPLNTREFLPAVNDNGSYNPYAQSNHQQASSDYGDFDSEMLDGEIFDAAEEPVIITGREGGVVGRPAGESTQREQWRQHRFRPPQPLLYGGNQQLLKGRETSTRHGPENPEVHGYNGHNQEGLVPKNGYQEGFRGGSDLIRPQSQDSAAVEKLQAQVQELRNERENLQNAVNSASTVAQSKIGEIAIIRANQMKADRENEQRMLTLQKQHADEAARYKLEAENARAEQKKIATEKGFLEFNLAEGSEKIRNLQKAVKQGRMASVPKNNGPESLLTTPKKNKDLEYGDGFNDDELQMVSPPRLSLRSKTVTPKAGAKRKRKAVENSPAKALPLSQPKDDQHNQPISKPSEDPVAAIANTASYDSERFRFTQKIFNHRTKSNQKRAFEELAAFAYPSNPGQALSTSFLDKLSMLTSKPKSDKFPVAIGNIFVSLWCQCINEKYYAPAQILMGLLQYILIISPFGTATYFTDTVVEYAQTTADVNIIPRFQRAPASSLKPGIDIKECLEILHLVAYGCIQIRAEIERFWRFMRFDFVIMILSITQPIEELHIAIGLLHTSVLENSFAMRVPPGNGTQGKSQEVVIDLMTRLLVETPHAAENAQPYDAVEMAELRLHVLQLMEAMCRVKHCGEALATHKDVIGRLVRVMNDELDALYDYHYGHENRSELVNHATRLLFYLTTTYPSLIDMQAKLRVIPGGTHRYLIALTRLGFSEGVFYEKGIEEDVAECAHQMLEMLVNPQEAEALLEAFSTAKK